MSSTQESSTVADMRGQMYLSDVEFFSLCPHHLLIYSGKIHFGYVPDGRIVGISKSLV